MVEFKDFAGQFVAGGTGRDAPFANLEEGIAENLTTLNGLARKISKTVIFDTRIFGDVFAPGGGVINSSGEKYGIGIEMASFLGGATNKKRDGTCTPRGTVLMGSQIAHQNYAFNQEIMVYDDEIDMSVLSEGEAGKYMAEKLNTPLATQALMHHAAWKQLISDVIPGTRTIVSNSRSDGAGVEVSYEPVVPGYAGLIDKQDFVVPAPVYGSASSITDSDALGIAKKLRDIASDFKYPSVTNNKLGVETFVKGRPRLIIEEKTINGMDDIFSVQAGYKGFPTVSAREYIGRFADITTIDAFPELPTNASYTGYRLGCVMLDPEAPIEIIYRNDVESRRCTNERGTGYNFQGRSLMTIYQGLPSYAMLAKPAAV